MLFKKIVKVVPFLGLAFFASQASAIGIDFDLTAPDSTEGAHGYYYATTYNYGDISDEVSLAVTGWSYKSVVTNGYYDWYTRTYVPGTETVTAEVESAAVGSYWANGIGVEEAWSPDHAVDNRIGDYDMLLLSFSEAVSLDSVSANWRGTMSGGYNTTITANNGDVSLLAYQGNVMSPGVSGGTWESLLGENWVSAGEHQLGNSNTTAVNTGELVSKYWLVGAYNKNLTAGDAGFSEHDDFFKLSGVSVSVNPVPLPGSMLLFGAALIGFGAIRRRKKA